VMLPILYTTMALEYVYDKTMMIFQNGKKNRII